MDWLGISTDSIDLEALRAQAVDFVIPRLLETGFQLLGVLIALWIARWIMARVEARLTDRTETEIDDILLRVIRRVLLISVAFWGLWRLGAIWELPRLADAVGALWIVALSLPVGRLMSDILEVLEQRFAGRTETKLDDTALPWVNRIAMFLVVGAAVLVALDHLGISIAPLLGAAGVAGLAVSFAAKDTLSNLIAGILLIVDRPFEVGDRIEVWSAPSNSATWGDVVEVGMRATKIRTPDNIDIVIPNSVIMQRDIINYTASGESIRLRIPIGIAYDADAKVAKKIILDVAAETDGVQEEPPPVCIIRSFGDSAVNLELRVWLQQARRRRAVEDRITDRVKEVFDERGIEIPFPKRDLYIKTAPEGAERVARKEGWEAEPADPESQARDRSSDRGRATDTTGRQS